MRKFLLSVAFMMTMAVIAVVYVTFRGPDSRDLSSLTVESTPERIARGEYLARHLLACVHCHTRRDAAQFHMPASGPEFAGGECLDEAVNFPGVVCAPNITSDNETGLGVWTDDEILRAVREGVSRDGHALFPLMPYASYRELSDEDAYAVVAYLRTIPPAASSLPPTRLGFPVSLYVNRLPKPLEEPVRAPPKTDRAAYGAYLATVASCKGCHGGDLSGGEEFPSLQGVVRAPNITPHETGLAPAALDDFLRLFRRFAPANAANIDVEDGLFTVMPWAAYAGVSDDDLAAIHAYLRTVPPIDNQIQTYGPIEN